MKPSLCKAFLSLYKSNYWLFNVNLCSSSNIDFIQCIDIRISRSTKCLICQLNPINSQIESFHLLNFAWPAILTKLHVIYLLENRVFNINLSLTENIMDCFRDFRELFKTNKLIIQSQIQPDIPSETSQLKKWSAIVTIYYTTWKESRHLPNEKHPKIRCHQLKSRKVQWNTHVKEKKVNPLETYFLQH